MTCPNFFFFLSCYCAHRDLHTAIHSFPTRRSSDLGKRVVHGSHVVPRAHPAAGSWRLHEIGRHTSELQSHSGISYAVFCLKKKKNHRTTTRWSKDMNRKTENRTTRAGRYLHLPRASVDLP